MSRFTATFIMKLHVSKWVQYAERVTALLYNTECCIFFSAFIYCYTNSLPNVPFESVYMHVRAYNDLP